MTTDARPVVVLQMPALRQAARYRRDTMPRLLEAGRVMIARLVNRFRRCPKCGVRGYGTAAPRWEDDPVAKMLGIADKGCPCCGNGAAS